MDRNIIYAGAVPLDTDMLYAGRFAKVGLGKLASQVYGDGVSAAEGFALTFSTTAMTLTVGAGSVLAPGVVDVTAIGATTAGLAADSTAVTVQYLLTAASTLTLSAGTTYGIYAVCSDSDTTNTVAAFFNSSNPSQTLSGQGNDATAMPTVRSSTITIEAATSAPTTPTGGAVVLLYTVTVPSSVTNLSTTSYIAAETLYPTIPQLKSGRVLNIIDGGVSQNYTVNMICSYILLKMCSGGASAAGASTTSSTQASVSSGGSSGSYAYVKITRAALLAAATLQSDGTYIIPITIAAGGAAVTGAMTGNSGGTSTFGSLVSCPGGLGGVNTTGANSNMMAGAVTGGAYPTIASSVTDLGSASGNPSTPGLVFNITTNFYGQGGSGGASPFGAPGGAPGGAGAAGGAGSRGSGGGGTVNALSATTATTGGAGGSAWFEIWEIS
ncbi:hypothetical protein [Acetobacter sp. DsW_063]|uniref:glycine-rich domain-containing protein n=1 Tax=Acetobacter sp. DsW_063 TaxID=1514894 RepID=UPI000A3B9861|nr:hypothetical protein [Acetobacter sp. DsW_063]OUJ16482.1 hypothetical protein HK28_12450 [Acetobacter sp. DsW_063]